MQEHSFLKNNTVFNAQKKHSIAHHALLDFKKKNPQEKEELIKRLYDEVYTITEYGRNYDTFKSRFYDRNLAEIDIHVMQNSDGKFVGYSIIRRFMIQYPQNSMSIAIFRTSAAVLPAYRGQAAVFVALGVVHVLNNFHKLNPTVNIVSFNAILNPLIYDKTLKLNPVCYPNPTQETPEKVLQFLFHLKYYFNYKNSDLYPYVIEEENKIILSEEDKKKFSGEDQPLSTQFFYKHTQLKPGKALLVTNFLYLTCDNPFGLEPTEQWLYKKYQNSFSSELIPLEQDHLYYGSSFKNRL